MFRKEENALTLQFLLLYFLNQGVQLPPGQKNLR